MHLTTALPCQITRQQSRIRIAFTCSADILRRMKHILILCAAVQLVSAPLAHSADDYKPGADSQPKVYLEIDTCTDVPATAAGKCGA